MAESYMKTVYCLLITFNLEQCDTYTSGHLPGILLKGGQTIVFSQACDNPTVTVRITAQESLYLSCHISSVTDTWLYTS